MTYNAINISGGAGTYYLTPGGMNTDVNSAQLLPSACQSIKLVSGLNGVIANFTSSYTLSLLQINSGANGPGSSVGSSKTCVLTPSTPSCVLQEPAANLTQGQLIQIKLVGTEALKTWGGNLYTSLMCEN